MPKHEQYEELTTLAIIGEASASELRDLKEHLDGCPECRQEYSEFVQFVLPQLSLAADLQPVHEMTAAERQAIRSDFLTKAGNTGIRFSEEALAGRAKVAKTPELTFGKSPNWFSLWLRYGLAAGLAAILVAGGFFLGLGRSSSSRMVLNSPNATQAKPAEIGIEVSPAEVGVVVPPNPAAAETRVSELEERLNQTIARLEESKVALDLADKERTTLREEIEQQNRRLKDAQAQKQTSDEGRASLQAQLEKLEQKQSALESDYASQTAALVELADKLKQQKAAVDEERQLASTGTEVHDLMASRNLHIVDVFDTDTHGKTQPIFGRVFFAENKQLVFYAYDLNDVAGHDTKIDYHVWGQKEGPGHSAKSLGVFRPDDQAQRRWVFRSDDQALLGQIDSIFVTVEKSDTPKAEPKGQKLMYAYLRDRPNHP